MEPAVEVIGLVKRYGARTGVDGAGFCAAAGAVTAVLGPNGAGKTTTIECCEGLRRPDGGTVRVLGENPWTAGVGLRARVGVMLQDGGLPGAARAGDVLKLAAALHRHPHPPAELLELLDLTGSVNTPARRLSGGQRQRLAMAVALVGRPEVVFLDEPTSGLDPQARQRVWEVVRRLRADGVAVLLTTHLLDEAERLADHVVLLSRGTVVAAGSPAELTGGGESLRFEAAPGLDLSVLSAVLPAGIAITEDRPGRYVAAPTADDVALNPAAVAAVTAWCADRGVMPHGLTLSRRSLEDVFLEIAGTTAGNGAAAP